MRPADALFLVDRGGTNHHSKGSDIGTKMVAGDSVLVQRGTDRFKATYDGSDWTKIQDSDLVLAWDGTDSRKVTGANFKNLFITYPVTMGVKKAGIFLTDYLELSAPETIRWEYDATGAESVSSIYLRSDGYTFEQDKPDDTGWWNQNPDLSWNFEWVQYTIKAVFPSGITVEDTARVRLLWFP